MAAENAQIRPGDIVAVWGCGPVARFAIKSSWMLGAGRVIGIDCVSERLQMAADQGKAETIDFEKENFQERLMEMTNGRGPDSCIDAVDCEAHSSSGLSTVLDQAKALVALSADRPQLNRALRGRGAHFLLYEKV